MNITFYCNKEFDAVLTDMQKLRNPKKFLDRIRLPPAHFNKSHNGHIKKINYMKMLKTLTFYTNRRKNSQEY